MDFDRYFSILISWLYVLPWGILCIAPMKGKLRLGFRLTLGGMLFMSAAILPVAALIPCCFNVKPNAVLLPVLVLYFIAYRISVTATTAQAAAIFLFVGAFMSVATNLAYAVDAAYHPEGGAGDNLMTFALCRLLFSIMLPVVFYHMMKTHAGFLINHMKKHYIWAMRSVISGTFLIINVIMIPQKYETLYVNNIFTVFLCLQFVIFFLEILIGVSFYHVLKNLIEASDTKIQNDLMDMQEQSFEKQQRFIEESARVRHDFKHTIQSIKYMADNGEYEELKQFLDEYSSTIPEKEIMIYCKSSALNALLNHYRIQAEKFDIKTTYSIELPPPEKAALSSTELCSIVGNILDNAIHAASAQREGERFIRLTLQMQRTNDFYIVAVNSFDGKPNIKGGRYESTDRRRSGLGIRSIENTVQKHGGITNIYHKGTEFYTDIMVPAARG